MLLLRKLGEADDTLQDRWGDTHTHTHTDRPAKAGDILQYWCAIMYTHARARTPTHTQSHWHHQFTREAGARGACVCVCVWHLLHVCRYLAGRSQRIRKILKEASLVLEAMAAAAAAAGTPPGSDAGAAAAKAAAAARAQLEGGGASWGFSDQGAAPGLRAYVRALDEKVINAVQETVMNVMRFFMPKVRVCACFYVFRPRVRVCACETCCQHPLYRVPDLSSLRAALALTELVCVCVCVCIGLTEQTDRGLAPVGLTNQIRTKQVYRGRKAYRQA